MLLTKKVRTTRPQVSICDFAVKRMTIKFYYHYKIYFCFRNIPLKNMCMLKTVTFEDERCELVLKDTFITGLNWIKVK